MAKRKLVEVIDPEDTRRSGRDALCGRMESWGLDPGLISDSRVIEVHYDGRQFLATYLGFDVNAIGIRKVDFRRRQFHRSVVTRRINYRQVEG